MLLTQILKSNTRYHQLFCDKAFFFNKSAILCNLITKICSCTENHYCVCADISRPNRSVKKEITVHGNTGALQIQIIYCQKVNMSNINKYFVLVLSCSLFILGFLVKSHFCEVNDMSQGKLMSIEFEVFGRVQGMARNMLSCCFNY